jgi:hypothetical protein
LVTEIDAEPWPRRTLFVPTVMALAVEVNEFDSVPTARAGDEMTLEMGAEGIAVPGAMVEVSGAAVPAWTVTTPRLTEAVAVTCAWTDAASRIDGRMALGKCLQDMAMPGKGV